MILRSAWAAVAALLVLAPAARAGWFPNVPVSKQEDTIQPGDRLYIYVKGTPPEDPIHGVYRIEPAGTIPLGPSYGGRVMLKGLTLEEAEKIVWVRCAKFLKDPTVQVTRYDPLLYDNRKLKELEERVRQLEGELMALREEVKKLKK